MKRIALCLAVATFCTTAIGCGCCRRKQTQTVAVPAAPMCAPACPPACGCDPCASGGMPVYGGATFAPNNPVYAPATVQ